MNTYNVRVVRDANTALQALLDQGRLQPTTERISGAGGPAYRVAPGHLVEPLDDFTLRVAGAALPVHLYSLPPEEYAGLLAAAPEFSQFTLAPLVAPLRQPMSGEEQEQWLAALAQALRAGPRVDPVPRLVQHPVHAAPWRPGDTLLARSGCGWIVRLTFDPPRVDFTRGMERSAVGVDIGLHSLAVAAFASGAVHRLPGITDLRLGERDLSGYPVSGRDLERYTALLQHAAARGAFQHLLLALLSGASVVYIEDLTYDDMTEVFRERSRTLGIRDYLLAWLPQRLAAQGIVWERVSPDHSSQYCSLTHLRGERTGRTFVDGNGQVTDADLNAARNLLHLGLAKRLGFRRR